MTSTQTEGDVVALLLGDTLPPERLGALLHAGRKRKGWKRKQAAAMVRISAKKLRDYEKGVKPIPPEICERLAECYGSDLTAHVPMRSIPEFSFSGGPPDTSAAPDDVIATYVAFLRRVRRAKPGEPLPLRAADLGALSAALDADPEVVEQRIMDELGCSLDEARALHRQVLLRRVVLPVAGLAAGVGVIAGIQSAHATPDPKPAAPAVVHAPAVETAATHAPAAAVAPADDENDSDEAAEYEDDIEIGDPLHAVDPELFDAEEEPEDPFAGEPQIGDDDFEEPPFDMPPPVIVDGEYTEISILDGEEPSYDPPTTYDEPQDPEPPPPPPPTPDPGWDDSYGWFAEG